MCRLTRKGLMAVAGLKLVGPLVIAFLVASVYGDAVQDAVNELKYLDSVSFVPSAIRRITGFVFRWALFRFFVSNLLAIRQFPPFEDKELLRIVRPDTLFQYSPIFLQNIHPKHKDQ